MIELWLFLKAINPKTWLYIAILAALSITAYKCYSYVFNRGLSHQKEVDSQSIQKFQRQIALDRDLYAQSLKDSSKQTLAWQAKTDKANEEANNAQIKLQNITADNRKLTDSLQQLTSKADERISLPDTTKDAINEYTTVLGQVFAECTAKYSELGIQARKNGIDQQKLIDSYPQTKE